MELEEIKLRKKTLEFEILNKLKEFVETTGVHITNVSINVQSQMDYASKTKYYDILNVDCNAII